MQAIHVTYCHRLSPKLSAEDVCKGKIVDAWYRIDQKAPAVTVEQLVSRPWNRDQKC